MPTFKQLAKEYADRVRIARSPADVVVVAKDIRGLVYVDTTTLLSVADRKAIVALVQAELTPSVPAGQVYIQKHADNQKYLDLVKMLQQLVDQEEE